MRPDLSSPWTGGLALAALQLALMRGSGDVVIDGAAEVLMSARVALDEAGAIAPRRCVEPFEAPRPAAPRWGAPALVKVSGDAPAARRDKP